MGGKKDRRQQSVLFLRKKNKIVESPKQEEKRKVRGRAR